MQQELVSPPNGDGLGSAISSVPFVPSNQRLPTPPGLAKGGDYFGLYPSIFSPDKSNPAPLTPLPGSGFASITPSSVSFDEEDPTATETRLYLARLTLQYQELAERYELCLSHLEYAAQEAEALHQDNANLRTANGELARRLSLLSGKRNGRIPPSASSIVDEFRRLRLGVDPSAQISPTSVLGLQENRFARRRVEDRIPLPKSISIRSSGYLKLKQTCGAGPASTRIGGLRLSNPCTVGPLVSVTGGSKAGEAGGGAAAAEEALEIEAYNQGMFKTELCNKWEETGECPYGENCQFAHGIRELRPVVRHPRYKTEVCRMVLAGDPCSYGHRCHFRHTISPDDCFLPRPT